MLSKELASVLLKISAGVALNLHHRSRNKQQQKKGREQREVNFTQGNVKGIKICEN